MALLSKDRSEALCCSAGMHLQGVYTDSSCCHGLPARLTRAWRMAGLVLLLLLGGHLVGCHAASSKYACDYSNRLCQWNARYMFGATVIGDKAFFNGGLMSDDASTPVNGSAFEVIDLNSRSPFVIQVQSNETLVTSRYRHQLVAWRDTVLMVGGQRDDSNGASQKVISVIGLDLNTRNWRLLKQFHQPGYQSEIIFENSMVVGDKMLIIYQSLPLPPAPPSRQYLWLDLLTASVSFNHYMMEDVRLIDWPLIGAIQLADGSSLLLQAMRQLPNQNATNMFWYGVKGDADADGPLSWMASTTLKQLVGGTGGKVLALSLLHIHGKPNMVTWTRTNASFAQRSSEVNAVLVHNIGVTGGGKQRRVALRLASVFMTLPLGAKASDVRSVDLPLHGNVAVATADVTVLPYVGKVDLIGDLDSNSVNIQEWPGRGFIIRGSGLPDIQCQPVPKWQSFVVAVDTTVPASPTLSVVSNNTWCGTNAQQTTVAGIVSGAASLQSNAKLHRLSTAAGPLLFVLNAEVATNPGGQLVFLDTTKPLLGATIAVQDSSITSFSVEPPGDYIFPAGYASCMTHMGNAPFYVQSGGWNFDDAGKELTAPGVNVIPVPAGKADPAMMTAAGGSTIPGVVFGSMACTSTGLVYLFGGLAIDDYEVYDYQDYDADGNVVNQTASKALWTSVNTLHTFQITEGAKTAAVNGVGELLKPRNNSVTPTARNGHALLYLPAATVARLCLEEGALLLYGGSNVTSPTLGRELLNETMAVDYLSATAWDTTVWLYDIAADKWLQLPVAGSAEAPPGLMYHSMTVQGNQVMLFGGLHYSPRNYTVRLSTDLYVLDFSEDTPRWRRAAVGNINVQGALQHEFPNTGIAALPELGVVALQHRSGISLAPIPQSFPASAGPTLLSSWGLSSLNLTAGDWIRFSTAGAGLTVQQPLLVAGDIILTGMARAAPGCHLMQQPVTASTISGKPVVQCGVNATSAVAIMSSGAVLEDLVITGCNGSAVAINIDATGAYIAPAVLRNITIKRNKGKQGAAVKVSPAAAVKLEECSITSNAATDSVVYADRSSVVELLNSNVTYNNGTGLVFAGSRLLMQETRFINNTAYNAVVGANRGGALRLTYEEAGDGGCSSSTTIINSVFVNNTAMGNSTASALGGAIFLGARTFAQFINVSFSSNAATEGGAIVADRDACLSNMTAVNFQDNTARGRGGAVLMRNPGCPNITWTAAVFSNNTAGGDGGAMYLTELSMRNIQGQGVFVNNKATGSVSGGGDGGAVYLGMWASRAHLYNSSFTNNTAAGRGGAVSGLAIEGSITLVNSTADSNHAGLAPASTPPTEVLAYLRRVVRSEGGAVHIQGSHAQLNLINTMMESNTAGRGGAVSVNSELGSFSATGSTFTSNSAWTAGGAVSVTERKQVVISNSIFTGNELFWPELAAGGGLYCFLCENVKITDSEFTANRASYGGGAAVLQPASSSSISNTLFADNVALPFHTQHGRVLVAKPQFVGSMATNPASLAQEAGPAILGPIAGNTTGDTGYYTGGGGLYMSVTGLVSVIGSAFVNNYAYNGGGLLARTDACKPLQAQPDTCRLVLSGVSVQDNNATAGGGLLVTNISSSVVTLQDCANGSVLDLNTSTSCLQADNALSSKWKSSSSSARRRLQQQQMDPPSAVAADGSSGSDNTVTAGSISASGVISTSGDFLVTSAAELKCFNMLNSSSIGPQLVPVDCNETIAAGPGIPFNPSFQLLDGLGRPIQAGVYDAQMPMQASLYEVDGTPANYVLLGRTTQALNGNATFAGLSIKARPNSTYQLRFVSGNGLTVTRQLTLRACQAGERTKTEQVSDKTALMCDMCLSPEFSFYPEATRCSQCSLLTENGYLTCNGPAVVPANGFYQSHPGSPLLHRCINPSACYRRAATQLTMANWAYQNAGRSTAQLTVQQPNGSAPLYLGYQAYMCAEGYTGPLCGACLPGYGHSAQSCVTCVKPPVNSFMYLLVSCFMFIIPALQMLMHSKNVQKRTQQLRIATTAQAGRPVNGEGVIKGPVEEHILPSAGNKICVQLVPIVNPKQQQQPAAGQADLHSIDVGLPGSDQHAAKPLSTIVLDKSAECMDIEGQASVASVVKSPFYAASHHPAAAQQDSQDQPAPAAPAAPAVSRAPAIHKPRCTRSVMQRLFAVESVEEAELGRWSISTAPTLAMSLSVETSIKDAAMVPTNKQSGSACGSEQLPAVASGAPLAVVPSNGAVLHRRAFKFWHTDVLTMLVNYMQLLGLLRLIRLNWPEYLRKLLVFLDFTSAATSWVSLECRFSSSTWLTASAKRAVMLLLWPVIALAVLGVYWGGYMYFLRRQHRVVTIKRYLQPHAIMSAVIMLYFLYTPTSREIISLFSCQPVDDPSQLPKQARASMTTLSEAKLALVDTSSGGAWSGVWTSNTSVQCGAPLHLGLAIGFGIPGLVLFVFGLPVALWVLLRRNVGTVEGHSRLEDPEVELKYGLMYDKYRYKRYYWECVILLENGALTMLLVLLQSQPATLQVLVAMAVIFIGAVLHFSLQPYACHMLDTLRRVAVYGLMSTLFLIMLVSLSDFEDNTNVAIGAMIAILIINVAVIGLHFWACCLEARRWLLYEVDREKRGYLTWTDLCWFIHTNLLGGCGGRLERTVRWLGGPSAVAADAPPCKTGPPAETITGFV